jgi:hypothetical protein
MLEEILEMLIGRTIEGIETDDDALYIELDNDKVLGVFVDDDGGLEVAILEPEANQ